MGIRSIVFDTFDEAVKHAKDGAGGWLCLSEDRKEHAWFAPSVTQSQIIYHTSHFGTRTIGTWPMFVIGDGDIRASKLSAAQTIEGGFNHG